LVLAVQEVINLQRADKNTYGVIFPMFEFGRKKEIKSLDDLKHLMEKEGNNFPQAVKKLADDGNIVCQEFMATIALNFMENAPRNDIKEKARIDFLRYATPVAKSGNAIMQFNLGLSYSKLISSEDTHIDGNGLNNLKEARYWYRKAADQGMREALESYHVIDGLISSIESRINNSDDYEGEDEDEDEGFETDLDTGNSAEEEYNIGVQYLQKEKWELASHHLSKAAHGGHVSATYNLALLWGAGKVTPYNFDIAADCWYKAAAMGHAKAKDTLWLLEAADRGGFGVDNLVKMVSDQGSQRGLVGMLMICAARFFDVTCKKYGATNDVIAYELDAAATSDWPFVHAYLKRTGIAPSFYKNGLNRLLEGSPADQITDGLNKLATAMIRVGFDPKVAVMARCSIVGYIISKSPYGDKSEPLLGLDQFFRFKNEESSNPLLDRLFSILSNEKAADWFVHVAYGWDMGLPADVGEDVNEAIRIARTISMLHGIDIADLAEAVENKDYDHIREWIGQ
jgi:TPR repeat protein